MSPVIQYLCLNQPFTQNLVYAPLEWILLTSLAVESLDDARLMLRYYALRWLIERLHYTLKSGCQIEKLELETVERLQNALAVYLMVAWRLLWLVYQSRLDGQQSCEIVLETHEWQALFAVMHEGEAMPNQAPTLQQAILWIARLGGFLARKRDGSPGVKVLWRGWSRLTDIVRTWSIAQRHFSPS
jgi:Transposase Tn5 dimerisation domain